MKHIDAGDETHQMLSLIKVQHKHKSLDQTLLYLVRFYRSMERKDKELVEKLKFNLN